MDNETLIMLKSFLLDLGNLLKGSIGDLDTISTNGPATSTEAPDTRQVVPTTRHTPEPKNRSKNVIYGQKHNPSSTMIPSTDPDNQVRQDQAYLDSGAV